MSVTVRITRTNKYKADGGIWLILSWINVDHGTRDIVFRLGSLAFHGTVDTCMQMAVIDRGDRVRGAAIAPVDSSRP